MREHLNGTAPQLPKLPDLSGLDSALTKLHSAADSFAQTASTINVTLFIAGALTATVVLLALDYFVGPYRSKK